jgi:hypothetical protein
VRGYAPPAAPRRAPHCALTRRPAAANSLAEVSRYCFAVSGTPYEDHRCAGATSLLATRVPRLRARAGAA